MAGRFADDERDREVLFIDSDSSSVGHVTDAARVGIGRSSIGKPSHFLLYLSYISGENTSTSDVCFGNRHVSELLKRTCQQVGFQHDKVGQLASF